MRTRALSYEFVTPLFELAWVLRWQGPYLWRLCACGSQQAILASRRLGEAVRSETSRMSVPDRRWGCRMDRWVCGCLCVALLGLQVHLTGPTSAADPDARRTPPLLPGAQWQPNSFDDLIPKQVEDATTAFDAYDRRDYATALRLLRPLADDGNASRSLISAICISMGWVSARTVPKGLSGIASQRDRATSKHSSSSAPYMAMARVSRRTTRKPAKWYRLAAGQGHVIAQYFLGRLYERVKNYAEAAKWYRYSADKGSVDAQVSLGGMYDFGRGVPQNNAEAAKWYRRAAGQGDALAQFLLGLIYSSGVTGVTAGLCASAHVVQPRGGGQLIYK